MSEAREDRSPDRRLVALAQTIGRAAPDRYAGFRAICEAAASLIDVERVGIWLYDDANASIECKDLFERTEGLHSAGLKLEARAFPAYFAALSTARIIAADDALHDPRTSEFMGPMCTW